MGRDRGGSAARRLAGVGLLLALALALGLWLRPYALAIYHLEAGGRRMAEAEALRGTRPKAANKALDGALRHFQRAIRLNPADGYAHRRLGQAWLLAGNNAEALDAFSQALALRPYQSAIHIELGRAWDGLGEVDKALAEYELSGYGPAKSEAIVNYLKLADWKIAAGGGDEALHILYDKVLALDPGNLPALHRVATIYEGMGAEAAGFALPVRDSLRFFQFKSIRVPTEPRLADYLAQTMIGLVEDGTWTRQTLLHVVAYQVQEATEGGPALRTEKLLQALLDRWPEDPDLLFAQGELALGQARLDQAEAAYRRVLEVDAVHALAALRLADISRSRAGDPPDSLQLAEAVRWYRQHLGAAPGDRLALRRLADACAALARIGAADEGCRQAAEKLGRQGTSPASALDAAWRELVATAQPTYPVGQRLDGGWTLLGYDLDEERLIQGLPEDLLLYWQGPLSATAGAEEDGWYRAGDRWVQVLAGVRNLVFNGGFELGEKGGLPAGFPWDVYPTEPGVRQLAAEVRAGQQTMVALLDNTAADTRSGFSSTHVPIKPEALYLQAGWIRSDGGTGYLGLRWLGDLAEGANPYAYIVTWARSEAWQHYAGVAQPVAGATRCLIWLLNYQATGQVAFDNILFVEIGRPGP